MKRRVAVVGAGISGLSCAHELRAAGDEVVVVDKSRGPSGRMSTRRSEVGSFDHGAQYFTARGEDFGRVVAQWEAAGVVARWGASFGRLGAGGWAPETGERLRFVGTPSMSAICRAMSAGVDLRLGAQVQALRRDDAGWTLETAGGSEMGPFDAVALSCPAPQAMALLADLGSPRHGGVTATQRIGLVERAAAGVEYAGTWALMLGFDAPVDAPFDAMRFETEVLAWAARDSSKPGRKGGERWVVHASSEWSAAHMQDEASTVEAALLKAFARHVDLGAARVTVSMAHRWRYARSTSPAVPAVGSASGEPQAWVWDPVRALGLCGDGLTRARVESAWASGLGLGRQMAAALVDKP